MVATKNESRGLEIRLLGRLELLRGPEQVALPTSKKSRALLAYLVATARAQQRERLCELLWEVPDDPRASLRWSLAKIRPLVDDQDHVRLCGDRDEISFDPKGARIDSVELTTALAGGAAVASIEVLRRAALLFRGEFLDGLDLTGCYRYHEWWIGERERARALRVTVLTQLIGRLRDTPEEALEYARQLLSLDPLSEGAHVLLIRLLGSMGRTREAIAQYERCKRVLASELGAEPSAELKLARIALSDTRAKASAPPAQNPDPAETATGRLVHGELPLVGRKEERALIESQVAASARGAEHRVLQITGDPGIGKTRMLEEIARAARRAGGKVLSGRAFEAETVRPYGPFIDALRSVSLPELSPALRADLLPLLPELGEAPAATGDRNRLFDAVVKLLMALVPPSGLIVVLLDDLQWFDEASAALLHFGARALSRSRVLLACAARPIELADNPVAQRLLRSLAREGHILDIDLRPLTTDETVELVSSVCQGADAQRVFAESEGNPFFALEMAGAQGRGEDPLSKTLEQLMRDRFDRLDTRALALLPWLAALGRSFRAELLEHAVSLAPAEWVYGIEELERRGVLRSTCGADGTTSYDFSHDLLRQAAYRQTSEPRKRLLHLEIARGLSRATDPSGALAADVAHHAALGGDDELCVRACISAGRRCIRIFANVEAQSLADRGRQRLDRLIPALRVSLHMELLRLSVEAGLWRKNAQDLATELSRAVFEAQSTGLQTEVAVGWELLSEVQEEGGDVQSAKKSLNLSEQASRDADPETKARAIARAGRCLVQIEHEIPRSRALLDEATILCAPMKLDLPDIPLGLGMLHYHVGDYDSAERLLEQAWAFAADTRAHWLASESLSRLIMVLLEQGRAKEALVRCFDLKSLAAKLGEGSELPFALTLEALARLGLGESGASARVEMALQHLRQIDTKGQLAYALCFVAQIELSAGNLDSAFQRASEALPAAEAVMRATGVARSRAILARVALQSGDVETARAHVLALRTDLIRPFGIAAGTREAVAALALELGVDLSTEVPTATPTPRDQTLDLT